MNKLFLSAFALSLTLLSGASLAQIESVDDFLGIESEILPDLEGPQRFTPTELHEKRDWVVEEKVVVLDKEPLKGQGHSIIPWKGIDPEGFLSIDHWLNERAIKDVTPDWKLRLRDQRHLGLVGKVIKCVGVCPVYRGTEKANVEHLSRIVEGDEFHTEKDSFAWVYLMDGTMVRIGAESSVTFHEILVSKSEILYVLRLNHGHLYWHPKGQSEYKSDFRPETDSIFLPLMVREANLEWFERKRFASQTGRDRLLEVMDLDELAKKDQLTKINELRASNQAEITKYGKTDLKIRMMVVSPNVTVNTLGLSMNMIHIPGGNSWFKRAAGEGELTAELRGYLDVQTSEVFLEGWNEVDPTGRMMGPGGEYSELSIAELLTARIQSIELLRELWIKKFTLPLFAAMDDQRALGIEQGYRLWDEKDLQKRKEFLKEYNRRMETTHLRSVENLLTRLEESGESPRKKLGTEFYQKALNHYLLGLKSRYTQQKMRTRELNEFEYYVWLLRNGKF